MKSFQIRYLPVFITIVLGFFVSIKLAEHSEFVKELQNNSRVLVIKLTDFRTSELQYSQNINRNTISADEFMKFSGKSKIPVVKMVAARKDNANSKYNNAALGFISMPVIKFEGRNTRNSEEVVAVCLLVRTEGLFVAQGSNGRFQRIINQL